MNFTWRFNGSTEGGEAVPLQAIRNKGTSSMLNYTASLEQDYGTLLCWATNLIGVQREPCVIHLIPAGWVTDVAFLPWGLCSWRVKVWVRGG